MIFIMIDWSQFDKRVYFKFMDVFYDTIKTCIDFSQYIPTHDYPEGKPTSATNL